MRIRERRPLPRRGQARVGGGSSSADGGSSGGRDSSGTMSDTSGGGGWSSDAVGGVGSSGSCSGTGSGRSSQAIAVQQRGDTAVRDSLRRAEDCSHQLPRPGGRRQPAAGERVNAPVWGGEVAGCTP